MDERSEFILYELAELLCLPGNSVQILNVRILYFYANQKKLQFKNREMLPGI